MSQRSQEQSGTIEKAPKPLRQKRRAKLPETTGAMTSGAAEAEALVPVVEGNWLQKEAAELGPQLSRPIKEAVERWGERRVRFGAKLSASEEGNRSVHVKPDYGGKAGYEFRRMDAFGTSSGEFAAHSMGRLADVARRQGHSFPTEQQLNAALAVVDGIRPENEVEAMLAMQMFTAHEAAMDMMERTRQATTAEAAQTYSTIATKFQRTFVAQIEAIAKLRRRGEQTVRVEHVHVYPGAQAIVGNVAPREGVRSKTLDNPMDPSIRKLLPLLQTPRCGARNRAGMPCQAPRAGGKTRCRLHGGAQGSGAPKGAANGRYRHGQYTCEAIEARRELRAMLKELQQTLDDL